ncbi:hypothetical protein G7Y89_g8571 [Cudoniella acicularis]|uniref:Uncharacterized protein n=1 Tax=Cudoniella acicularis TaxID=354080 RepID=A0A8H4RIL3_9HELO|nr:hypothetical protein G7Y89_g8571 [Cudoniella acicularis]
MSSGKGKGRALSEDDAEPIPKISDSSQDSILSRVAASASGLSQNLFAAPNSNELNERASAALSNAGKGTSHSGAGSTTLAFGESSKVSHQSSQGGARTASNVPEGFRVGHNEEHIDQSERDFSSFLDSIDSFTPSEQLENNLESTRRKTEITFGEAWARSQLLEDPPIESHPATTTVREQQIRDGEDVVALLSKPGAIDDQFEAPQADDENYDWGLTADQLSQLRGMMNEIFPPPESHMAISPDHPLNLVPNLEFFVEGPGIIHEGVEDQDLQAREQWREQWEGVLTRYTDEVWGGLLPLVKEAREEIRELRDDGSSAEQPKALRRLGAILAHLRK